jgi:alkylation response protein AidB-like acyl-CoA dehydrogenase
MDLKFSAEDEEYRRRLRSWLRENVDPKGAIRNPTAESGDENDPLAGARAWARRLHDAGYVGLAWPVEYGGQGATFTQQVICAEEMARARTPPLMNTIGLSIIGPTLVQHGTEEQKKYFLRRILRSTVTISSSADRRSGRAWHRSRIGSSCWCARIQTHPSERASAICSVT